MKKSLEKQIEWWYRKRELVSENLIKCKDDNTERILAENLKFVEARITELELKQIKRRKVGK